MDQRSEGPVGWVRRAHGFLSSSWKIGQLFARSSGAFEKSTVHEISSPNLSKSRPGSELDYHLREGSHRQVPRPQSSRRAANRDACRGRFACQARRSRRVPRAFHSPISRLSPRTHRTFHCVCRNGHRIPGPPSRGLSDSRSDGRLCAARASQSPIRRCHPQCRRSGCDPTPGRCGPDTRHTPSRLDRVGPW